MTGTRWMGVDLGEARVGMALSDPELTVANPAGNIAVYGDYFQALDEVIELAEDESAARIIVGLPLLLNGQEGRSAKKARRWAKALRHRMESLAMDGELALPLVPQVELRDERLTTVSAHRQLTAAGVGGRHHRPMVDQQSAVLLLQAALDEAAATMRSDIG
ncbi:Holliday junction resolvase RuvX [Bifidobacterium xylocopae]|uniref:Putative pre-16S rRNA nuclease n=1 Tax=Bifidobacterium xylocopae TaxID=2493119 RepID=A0A366KEJ8_9BIFI|nr:Holliday junction resolvase RuvX [Bifidobacterium xylocopae]RBQ00121.1 Holliday junction resolvase RuvX [Bifidobacterium xylocopae]